ncbi:MAG: VOC family protein [Oscillospiraceae bacterium]|nr:VOC family protein [Oscillospiraceae bacterium]
MLNFPSISFPGNCDEAITYYKEVLGAEVKAIVHNGNDPTDPNMDKSLPPNFVTYSEVLLFGTPVAMFDGAEKNMSCDNFWFTLSFDSAEEVTSVFNKLADGGKIVAPLSTEFYGQLMGSVNDRFGISWNVSIYFE